LKILIKQWKEFIDFGNDVDEAILNMRIKTIAPNKCASLIYTSGTTGRKRKKILKFLKFTNFEIIKILRQSEGGHDKS
jgi:acyl-coenzyme A synthetase/AMP-(fatty) acid ligase